MNDTIILASREPNLRAHIAGALSGSHCDVSCVDSTQQVMLRVANGDVSLVVMDDAMPETRALMSTLAQNHPEVVRIMLTENPSLSEAFKDMDEGLIYQYLSKPCSEIDLAIIIRRALEQQTLLDRSRSLLKVVRQESELLDEAMQVRRLQHVPHAQWTAMAAHDTTDTSHLVREIDEEVRKGEDLIQRAEVDRDLTACPMEDGRSVLVPWA